MPQIFPLISPSCHTPYAYAGRPFPLQNCTVSNQSADSLQVDCIEGFDGGLPQSFMLELVELNTLRLARNITVSVSVETARSSCIDRQLSVISLIYPFDWQFPF